ncbi:hypothetical protein D043_3898A, partial [Vibrio parahaemolyticus EKP-021]
MASKPPIPG